MNIGTIPRFFTGEKLNIWDSSLYINDNKDIFVQCVSRKRFGILWAIAVCETITYLSIPRYTNS